MTETMWLELGLVQYQSEWWGAGVIALLVRSDDRMPAGKTIIIPLLLKHTHSPNTMIPFVYVCIVQYSYLK